MTKVTVKVEKHLSRGVSATYITGGMALAVVTILGCLVGIPILASRGLVTSVVRAVRLLPIGVGVADASLLHTSVITRTKMLTCGWWNGRVGCGRRTRERQWWRRQPRWWRRVWLAC